MWISSSRRGRLCGGKLSVVFDSSALLAISFDEAGAERAARGLKDGRMSAVNVAEVISRYVDQGASEEEARASWQAFGLDIRPLTRRRRWRRA